MLWYSLGTFVFGTICGAALRLPLFTLVAIAFVGAFWVVASAYGSISPLAILALLAVIEFGYVAGLAVRAAIAAGLRKRGAAGSVPRAVRWLLFRTREH